MPSTLILNLQHYHSLHETIVIVTVKTEEIPFVKEVNRAELTNSGSGIYRVQLHYGFMEVPDVPLALSVIDLTPGHKIPVKEVTYFLGQEHLLASKKKAGMTIWREKLFAFMGRNSLPASNFFNLPPEQVVTVGLMLEI